MLELVIHRNLDWWFNEVGILLQLIGAVLLVWFAFGSRSKVKDVSDSWKGGLSERLRDEIAGQAFAGLYGFIFLAAGLMSQLVAGLLQK